MIFGKLNERTRFFRFAVVGSIGALVDFGVFNLLILFTTSPAVLASTISFIAAVLNNFFLNKYWTYPDSRNKSVPQQMIQFSIINILGLGIRIPLFAWLEGFLIQLSINILSSSFISPSFIGHNLALATTIIVVMFWNYFANRYWTFNDVS